MGHRMTDKDETTQARVAEWQARCTEGLGASPVDADQILGGEDAPQMKLSLIRSDASGDAEQVAAATLSLTFGKVSRVGVDQNDTTITVQGSLDGSDQRSQQLYAVAWKDALSIAIEAPEGSVQMEQQSVLCRDSPHRVLNSNGLDSWLASRQWVFKVSGPAALRVNDLATLERLDRFALLVRDETLWSKDTDAAVGSAPVKAALVQIARRFRQSMPKTYQQLPAAAALNSPQWERAITIPAEVGAGPPPIRAVRDPEPFEGYVCATDWHDHTLTVIDPRGRSRVLIGYDQERQEEHVEKARQSRLLHRVSYSENFEDRTVKFRTLKTIEPAGLQPSEEDGTDPDPETSSEAAVAKPAQFQPSQTASSP